jgi:hypothetical protein
MSERKEDGKRKEGKMKNKKKGKKRKKQERSSLSGPQRQSGRCRETKNLLPLPRTKISPLSKLVLTNKHFIRLKTGMLNMIEVHNSSIYSLLKF